MLLDTIISISVDEVDFVKEINNLYVYTGNDNMSVTLSVTKNGFAYGIRQMVFVHKNRASLQLGILYEILKDQCEEVNKERPKGQT